MKRRDLYIPITIYILIVLFCIGYALNFLATEEFMIERRNL